MNGFVHSENLNFLYCLMYNAIYMWRMSDIILNCNSSIPHSSATGMYLLKWKRVGLMKQLYYEMMWFWGMLCNRFFQSELWRNLQSVAFKGKCHPYYLQWHNILKIFINVIDIVYEFRIRRNKFIMLFIWFRWQLWNKLNYFNVSIIRIRFIENGKSYSWFS